MRAGPKPEIIAGPLDLSALPRSGARRVDAFAREYLTVTRGKGAKGPFPHAAYLEVQRRRGERRKKA